MYGTQTVYANMKWAIKFENDVKMYGTQTKQENLQAEALFENDVKMYGTQTLLVVVFPSISLRMM